MNHNGLLIERMTLSIMHTRSDLKTLHNRAVEVFLRLHCQILVFKLCSQERGEFKQKKFGVFALKLIVIGRGRLGKRGYGIVTRLSHRKT